MTGFVSRMCMPLCLNVLTGNLHFAYLLINEAVDIEHFMHSLGMGIFKHTGCSCGDEGWTSLLGDIVLTAHNTVNDTVLP